MRPAWVGHAGGMESHRRALAALGVPLIPADFELGEPGAVQIDDREDFVQAVRVTGAPVIFVMTRTLALEDFAAENGQSVQKAPDLAPYRDWIGEAASFHALAVVGGVRMEWSVPAPWWPEFVAACEQAREQETTQALTRRAAHVAATIQAAQARLPQDDTFTRLACERRPRITALRQRAQEVLHDVGPVTGGRVDEAIREIAAEVRLHRR